MPANFRSASASNNGSGTGSSYAVTLPTGWQANDLVLVLITVAQTTVAGFNTLAGWTLDRQDGNSGGGTHTTGVYYRVMQSGDSNPTFTSTTGGKAAWTAIAVKPGSGETLSINATAAPTINTTAGTSVTPPAVTATVAGCSVLMFGTRASAASATAVNVTQPTNWLESADSSTATGTTTATRQVEAESSYQDGVLNGSVAPGAASTNVSTCQNAYHYLISSSPGGFITEDASTPTVTTQTGTPTTITSASFSPPQGALLLALVAAGKSNNFASAATVTDSGGHTWTNYTWNSQGTSDNGGFVGAYYTYLSSAPGSITVTATFPSAFGTGGGALLDVRVLNGAHSDQAGIGAASAWWGYTVAQATANTEISVTTTKPDSVVYGISNDTQSNSVFTPNANTTTISTFADATDSCRLVTYRSGSLSTAGLFRAGGNWAAVSTSSALGVEVVTRQPVVSTAITAASTVTATRSDSRSVSPSITANSTVTANKTDTAAISAAITAASSVVANKTDVATITAAITAQSAVTGNKTDTANITAAITAQSTVTGSRLDSAGISSAVTAGTAVTGTRSDTAAITSAITATSVVTAARTDTAQLTAAVTSASVCTANKSDTAQTTAATTATSTVVSNKVDSAQVTSDVTAQSIVTGSRADTADASSAVTVTSAVTAVRTDTGAALIDAPITAMTTATGVRTDTGAISAPITVGSTATADVLTAVASVVTVGTTATAARTDSAVIASQVTAGSTITGVRSDTAQTTAATTATSTVAATRADTAVISSAVTASTVVTASRTDTAAVDAPTAVGTVVDAHSDNASAVSVITVGSVITAKAASPVGSWLTLGAIAQEVRELVEERREQEAIACPHDGEPLQSGPDGVLYCQYDGWQEHPVPRHKSIRVPPKDYPIACPYDGEPLQTGPDGQLYCPYDAWEPTIY